MLILWQMLEKHLHPSQWGAQEGPAALKQICEGTTDADADKRG